MIFVNIENYQRLQEFLQRPMGCRRGAWAFAPSTSSREVKEGELSLFVSYPKINSGPHGHLPLTS